MTEAMGFHVHHKCGLILAPTIPKNSKTDLPYCHCIGRTWFDYEEAIRTRGEAEALLFQHFARWSALYLRQGRNPEEFQRLAKEYLSWLHV